MEKFNLLVHRIDNNIENIEILLSEDICEYEIMQLIGKIIDEQMNVIIENKELYYIEDDIIAKNKKEILLLDFIDNIRKQLIINSSITIKTTYKEEKIPIDTIKLQKILKYLLSLNYENIDNIEIKQIDDELHIKINFEKKYEHSLQSK